MWHLLRRHKPRAIYCALWSSLQDYLADKKVYKTIRLVSRSEVEAVVSVYCVHFESNRRAVMYKASLAFLAAVRELVPMKKRTQRSSLQNRIQYYKWKLAS